MGQLLGLPGCRAAGLPGCRRKISHSWIVSLGQRAAPIRSWTSCSASTTSAGKVNCCCSPRADPPPFPASRLTELTPPDQQSAFFPAGPVPAVGPKALQRAARLSRECRAVDCGAGAVPDLAARSVSGPGTSPQYSHPARLLGLGCAGAWPGAVTMMDHYRQKYRCSTAAGNTRKIPVAS